MEAGMVSSNISRPSSFVFFHGIHDYLCIKFDVIGYNTVVETFSNSGALVRQRAIPTQRPPLVGEVSANFNG
jgi:hypothetical protein